MTLVHRLGQRVGNPRTDSDRGGLVDAKLHGDCVGSLKPNAADIARKPVWVRRHHLDGVRAIGLEDPHRSRRADAVAVQKDHDFPHRLLLGPGGEYAGGANWPDAVDLAQPVRCCLDDVEHSLAEATNQLLGVYGADTPDHARREISLDAVSRGWRRRAQKARPELLTVGAVIDPFARSCDPLACRNSCCMANHGYHVAMAACFGAQNAKAVLGVMVGYPLN